MDALTRQLFRLNATHLARIRRGIEKESLRVNADGSLAHTPHPRALGSALTHPNITTDFSEPQLELITGVHESIEGCLAELAHIHQAVYRALQDQGGEELLWCASMPCNLPDEAQIQLGQYGTSNVGRAKTVYRSGLAHRYGKRMQMISGIHYNFSLPEDAWSALGVEQDAGYFALIRNFRRTAWLCFYLFGASPAICPSFVAGREGHNLQPLGTGTLYRPYATSLRMGRLGYQSDAQASVHASANDLESYAQPIEKAMLEPYAPYEKIGITNAAGEYLQLTTSLLQIENEYYGKIRPKHPIRPGERPLHALRERGVMYVEVRLMDLDPFSPVGITAATMRLLDIVLLHCVVSPSPPDSEEELAAIARNQDRVAARGREPGVKLIRFGEEVDLRAWGRQLLAEMEPIAAALDSAHGTKAYSDVLRSAASAMEDECLTPAAGVLRAMHEKFEDSHSKFVLHYSRAHRDALLQTPFPKAEQERFAKLAAESLEEQKHIEASDTMTFEQYRQQYLAPERLYAKRQASYSAPLVSRPT